MKHLRTLNLIADVARTGSIRRTAERLNITASALTRKIQDFELEFGTPVFERRAQGMRLNAAGELLLRHIRSQNADFERLRSQVADLSGVRRGHVTIACSQAFAGNVLPDEIAAYRAQFPLVSFSVQVRDHALGVAALAGYEADLALLLHPPPAPEMQEVMAFTQPLSVMMATDHPLAAEAGPVRLRDCLRHAVALPDRSLAIRHLLDAAFARRLLEVNLQIESSSLEFLRNFTLREGVLSFQIASGIPRVEGLHIRPIDQRDLEPIRIVLGHLRGRALSIAAAKFADQLARNLQRLYGAA